MSLVSRRFNEACRDPRLWPKLTVLHQYFPTEAHWQSFLRWLAVRGSGLQHLVFGDGRVRNQCFAKCPFTCQFDRLSD
jgi:hypothetical protein